MFGQVSRSQLVVSFPIGPIHLLARWRVIERSLSRTAYYNVFCFCSHAQVRAEWKLPSLKDCLQIRIFVAY